jgi:hypothetical protein
MLRAGHELDHVRCILDAAEPEQLEHWIAEADEAHGTSKG